MYWEYVLAGYGFVFGGLLLYAFRVIRRGRSLSALLPQERRRFLDR